MHIPNEPGSWAQITRDNTTDLKQHTTMQTRSHRCEYREREPPNLVISNWTHFEAQVEFTLIVPFFARLQQSTLEFYILSPYETTI